MPGYIPSSSVVPSNASQGNLTLAIMRILGQIQIVWCHATCFHSMQGSALGQTAMCFQLGPVRADAAMQLTQNVGNLLRGPGLNQALAARNASYGSANFLFAFVASHPAGLAGRLA